MEWLTCIEIILQITSDMQRWIPGHMPKNDVFVDGDICRPSECCAVKLRCKQDFTRIWAAVHCDQRESRPLWQIRDNEDHRRWWVGNYNCSPCVKKCAGVSWNMLLNIFCLGWIQSQAHAHAVSNCWKTVETPQLTNCFCCCVATTSTSPSRSPSIQSCQVV